MTPDLARVPVSADTTVRVIVRDEFETVLIKEYPIGHKLFNEPEIENKANCGIPWPVQVYGLTDQCHPPLCPTLLLLQQVLS